MRACVHVFVYVHACVCVCVRVCVHVCVSCDDSKILSSTHHMHNTRCTDVNCSQGFELTTFLQSSNIPVKSQVIYKLPD